MDGPGSVRAARDRLSKMQSIRQKKQYEEYQKAMYGSTTGSPFGIDDQPTIAQSPQRPKQQHVPQWPLAPALAPRHIITAASTATGARPVNPAYRTQNMTQVATAKDQSTSAKPKKKRSRDLTPKANNTTSSSRKSSTTTVSSLGSIPDFPIANRSSNIPPPPDMPLPRPQMAPQNNRSTRYTQFAVVSPIAEERASAASVKSYASSHVMPSTLSDYFNEEVWSDEESAPRTPYKAVISPRVYVEKPAEKKPMHVTKTATKAGIASSNMQSKPLPTPKEEAVCTQQRPPLMRLPSTQYDPSKSGLTQNSRHARGYATEKGSDAASSLRRAPRSMLGERVGSRKPPNLEFEKPIMPTANRSSLTSLSDLITRATKVRHNLDRGKTASRLVTEWDMAARRKAAWAEKRQQEFMSSPGASEARTDWPSVNSGKDDFDDDSDYGRRRACCGPFRSRNTVIFMVLLGLILVIAAIVIPVVSIVIPRQQAKAAAAHSVVSQASSTCSRSITCSNGGLATQMPDKSCACTCVDGFSGTTCSVKMDATCASTNIDSNTTASVGGTIVPLLKAASNYNIPLDTKLLSDQFQRSNMSCANENGLVILPVLGTATASAASSGQLAKEQTASTINGIVVAATPAATATGTAAATTMTPIPISSGPGTNSSAQEFAKIGILFVLQDSRALDMATRAQQSLSSFMNDTAKNGTSRATASDVALGNGYSINMWDFAIKVRNGTVYGKK